MIILTRDAKTEEVRAATKFQGEEFRQFVEGGSVDGEGNVDAVARRFMSAINTQMGASYDCLDPAAAAAGVGVGVDCVMRSSSGAYSIRVQVTRALPKLVYKTQQFEQRRDLMDSISHASEWVMNAIRKKSSRASPDTALVIDAEEAPFLGFLTDARVLLENQVELELQQWHSIWIVGPFGARKLVGRELPGVGG